MFGTKHRLCTCNGDAFDLVVILLASVVPSSWVALGVVVCEYGAASGQYFWVRVILRGDKVERLPLAALLAVDGIGNLGIKLGKQR
jgi:hypothetical protein